VTEVEWLEWRACTDLTPLLDFVRVRGSHRKWRLFAVACCRQIWDLMTDERSRVAVEMAERHADRPAGESEIDAAWWASQDATVEAENLAPDNDLTVYATHAAYSTIPNPSDLPAFLHARATAEYAAWAASGTDGPDRLVQGLLLHDIFGNPFRPVTVSPAWQSPQVAALSQAAYDQRELPAGTLDLARLAVLADALEEAGCTDPDLLGHLRGPGPHVRGCWVVDLLLGKE
jgi:hypothetical protein